ncbi:hypothetical protein [Rhizobium leguminosarum]|uniref:hypothetical protein n=1 Tax=Rhizobium leguminosarum TaxID=384 RepID=UPI0012F68D27|nr:hypothetical protein [Rhizobium leguminosarum]
MSTATAGQRKLYLYDGSDDILLMVLDTATDAVFFSGLGAAIAAAAAKTVPAGADKLGLWDSVSGDTRGLGLDDLSAWLASVSGLTNISGCETLYISGTTIQMKTGYVFFNGRRTTFSSALTKALNATFVAGNAGGMLDTGVMQASKTYFIHAVRNIATGAGDWVASLQSDPTFVNIANLTGWEVQGRVNVVLTTSGNVIRQAIQDGNEYRLAAQVTEYSGGALATVDKQCVGVPAGISTEGIWLLNVASFANEAGTINIYAEAGEAPLASLNVNAGSSASANWVVQRSKTRSASGLIRLQCASSAGSPAYILQTDGFVDYLAPRRNGGSA